MSKTPSLTVAIANYNGARYLGATIDSVLSQSLADLQLVVVDNASSDGSRELVEQYDDPRVRLVAYDQHVPVTENWNRGLEHAGGTFFSLLHSDDIWYPTFAEELVAALDEWTDAAVALCNVDVIDEHGHVQERRTFQRRRRTHHGPLPPSAYAELLRQMDVFPCSWLARTDFIRRMRFDASFRRAPDWEFWIRVFERPERVVSLPRRLAGYRIHGSNDTFAPATIRDMVSEEVRIVDAGLRRKPLPPAQARRAWRMVDVRTAVRCGQMLARRQPRVALQVLRESARRRGLVATAAGAARLLTMPEVREAMYDLLCARRRRVRSRDTGRRA